ncbi:MAG: V-type ATPase subunit [Lachnospiraceae bacterium]
MGSLKKYSGLTTKVKAMRSRLLSASEYELIMECSTVSEVAQILKERDDYRYILEDTDSADIHRETLEYAIKYSGYRDFTKLYKFSNLSQRKYLKLFFLSYETELIKKSLRNTSAEYMTQNERSYIEGFINKYSKVPFGRLGEASSIEEKIRLLEGTIYYEPLKMTMDAGKAELYDLELALDMFYFKYIWKKRRVSFSNEELKSFTDTVGTEVDMLNLTWIYRAKTFYGMTQSEVAAMIIPIYHRIKKPQMLRLIETADIHELIGEIGRTPYGRHFTPDTFKKMELDRQIRKLTGKVYDKYYRLEPYSMAVMSGYLHDKSKEISRLISIVECIRYGYSKEETAKAVR